MRINSKVAAYGNSFLFGFALYTVQLLIPLYMHTQNFTITEIGIVVAAPSMIRLVVHPFAGLISDYIGERKVLIGSFAAIFVAGIFFSRTSSFHSLFIVQLLLMGVSRTFYWPAMQSYGSRINPDEVSRVLGRVASANSAGNMAGLLSAGYIVMMIDFKWTFIISAIASGVALLIAVYMPTIPKKQQIKSFKDIMRGLVRLAKVKQLYTGIICGFVAALPLVLISSFYPVYFKTIGMSEGLIGLFSAFFSIGFILLGLVGGFLIDVLGIRLLATSSLILMVISMFLVIWLPDLIVLLLSMLAIGLAAGGPNLIYQTTASSYSQPEERGAAIAISGYGFPIAYFFVPFIFGVVSDLISLNNMLLLIAH